MHSAKIALLCFSLTLTIRFCSFLRVRAIYDASSCIERVTKRDKGLSDVVRNARE